MPAARRSAVPDASEEALREAVAHESAEVLRHQLEAERTSSARMSRTDLVVSFFLAGIGVGVGWASVRNKKKRTKRRGR